jgi:UDP-N-acetylmuramyl pentapeptide phosphotransferase/UDP-N-acetylglucosamine-1-phosphate transferase
MTTIPLILATCLYLWISGGYLLERNYAMALVFLCYAGANIGFIWYNKGGLE